MKYVIIGNSTAGIAAIEGIRTIDKSGDITVVSSEKHHCYGRPTISYYLKGDIKREDMLYRPVDFYEKMGVKLMLGETATEINTADKQVVLKSGKNVEYDKLLVATGSRPFVPKMDGIDKVKKVFNFMTYDDMLALESVLAKDKIVLVVGAGLIGLKCVEGILERVRSVTVVDLADRVLPSVLDSEGAAFVQNKLQERGIKFVLGDRVTEFAEKYAKLKSGMEIPFDILVIAVGVVPNAELVKDAGGDCNRGIVIDAQCKTSLTDVYAAGDCAEGYDSSIDKNRVLAILPNAYFQGRCAGINLAGEENSFEIGIPMNAVGFFGLHVLSAGVYEGECLQKKYKDGYKKLFVKNNRLVGFILIGNIARAGIYTSLIRNKTDLNTLDKALLFDEPQLMAFSEETRKCKLARMV